MQVCGVDDAGRGSMIGPLVIAGVRMNQRDLGILSKIGVKDSKMLSATSRERIYEDIIRVVDDYYTVYIHPRSIDLSVKSHGLNRLEAKYMARVVSKLVPDVCYVDSCDVNPARFGQQISRMSNKCSVIKSYHHADANFVIVSAASILAKVGRDKSIAKLRKTHNLGSGYPSDKKTFNFVDTYYKETHNMPSFVRKSWKPTRRIMYPINGNSTIDVFFDDNIPKLTNR